MTKAVMAVGTAGLILALVLMGCGAGTPSSESVEGSSDVSVAIDHATLAEDGRSVDVVIIGGHPMAEGKECGDDYALAGSTVTGETLEVDIRQTAYRQGSCALTEGICCERTFTVALPGGNNVDRVRAAGSTRMLFIKRPAGLYELHGLPAEWALRREQGDWGGTWTRTYALAPLTDQFTTDTLIFGTTFGGSIVVEPEALQSPVMVNGTEATYQRYEGDSPQIQLQWIEAGQKMWLEAFENHFSIQELTALANGATPE